MQDRTCPSCGQDFTPTSPSQRFCPPTEADRQKKGQARSKCARRYGNHTQRFGQPPTVGHVVGRPFNCALCGERCVPGENVVSHATKFCSAECKTKWHWQDDAGANRRWAEENAAAISARVAARNNVTREAKRQAQETHRLLHPTEAQMGKMAWRATVRDDPCAYCGVQPALGIDHIDATVADRGDETNWTACCKRCNELKRTVPLLPALLWIPVTEQYHKMRRSLFTAAA